MGTPDAIRLHHLPDLPDLDVDLHQTFCQDDPAFCRRRFIHPGREHFSAVLRRTLLFFMVAMKMDFISSVPLAYTVTAKNFRRNLYRP